MLISDVVHELESTVDPDRLREYASHRSKAVRIAVAENVHLDDDVLLVLARDENQVVRLAAAGNDRARPDVEAALAVSTDVWVRRVLAHKFRYSRDQLTWDVQWMLARDADREVRERVAHTTNYRDVFDHLMADPEPRVRAACAQNPRGTAADLEQLITDRIALVRASVAGGWFARAGAAPTDEQLVRLARDRSVLVRWNVASRNAAPVEAWRIVAEDTDEMNRNEALRKLKGGDDQLEVHDWQTMFEGDSFDPMPSTHLVGRTHI